MKYALALISTVALVGCLSPSRFDAKFEAKFCEEWTACNPEFGCDLADRDYSDCDFDRKAAHDCLDSAWTCDSSNSALPLVVAPDVCRSVYVCPGATGTGVTTPTPSDTGTTTTTGSR